MKLKTQGFFLNPGTDSNAKSTQDPDQEAEEPPRQRNDPATSESLVDPALTALAQGPFGGITIIKLKDSRGSTEIHPQGGTRLTHIVTFVSPEGSYAALTNGEFTKPSGCIGWVANPSTDPTAPTFGLADAGPWSVNQWPLVCRPFTLRFEDETYVRVERGQYSRRAKVIARIPLVQPDWTQPSLARHEILGVRLGPIDSGMERKFLHGSPFQKVGLLQNGELKMFSVQPPMAPNQKSAEIVHGLVAPQELTGWVSDVLVASWFSKRFSQARGVSAFVKAVRKKYGRPTFTKKFKPGLPGPIFLWLYDLKGRKLQKGDENLSNCLNTLPIWGKNPSSYQTLSEGDIGPWGCSLVMALSPQKASKSWGVYGYNIVAVSGTGLALTRFKKRLAEVKEVAEKIMVFQSFKPNL